MLPIHYVSIMMRIFYIDWQQHWEFHRTVNIGDQQNSHKWQISVGLPVTSEREREREREREIKFIGLFENRGHRGPYSPYKPFNHNLYIGIIIFPHIDNPQYTGLTSERYWASFQVTRLFHNATVSHCDHFLLLHLYLLFETSPGWLQGWRVLFFYLDLVGSTQLQCIYYLRRILISKPPRVFQRFKRRSCWKWNEVREIYENFTTHTSRHFWFICLSYQTCNKLKLLTLHINNFNDKPEMIWADFF